MNAQAAVNKLCEHLLGKDWYIVDPVGVEQEIDIIVDQIIKRYPAVDESPVDKWRRKHKKCRWCTHCGVYTLIDPISKEFDYRNECKAKGIKLINENIPRPFCTLFELKKEKENAGN